MDDYRMRSISRHYNVPLEEVIRIDGITTSEALKKYLTQESKERLEQHKGINLSDENPDKMSKLTYALLHFGLGEYKEDFNRTTEGKFWYEFNVAIPNALAGNMVSDSYESFDHEPKKLSSAEKVAGDITLKIIQEGIQYRKRRKLRRTRPKIPRRFSLRQRC